MRYALISDIHGNLPALEAVLADIDRRGKTDAICHLGDLLGYAPWPNDVVSLLRCRSIPRAPSNVRRDGDWRAGYGVVAMTRGAVDVRFFRVAYDLEEAMEGIRASDLPDDFAGHLRTGGVPKPVERAADAG